MHGARWGWVALIAAITVLFVASSQDQSSNNKMSSLLRQELKTTISERDRIVAERDEAHEAIETLQGWSQALDQELSNTHEHLRALKAERDKIRADHEKLRKEITSLSQDRNQLQQTVASLHVERSQTRRNVEQLRQGLQQLLTQSDGVASQLAGPAPGFAQTTFEETPVSLSPVQKNVAQKSSVSSEGTYHADEPLNDNQ